jgi:DNA/RNA endonuclease G (NUC1)
MKTNHQKFGMTLVLACCFSLFVGCASLSTSVHHETRPALGSELSKQAGFSSEETKWIDANCPLGMPLRQARVDFGFTKIIPREGYVLEHSAKDKIPIWVCERLTSTQVSGSLNRPKPEPFAPDPALKGAQRAELKDYRGSGYDRGHQAPSADQSVNKRLQAETYFLSNMSPQRGELNQRI